MDILAVSDAGGPVLRLWFKKSRGKKAFVGETRTWTDGLTYRKYGQDDWRPITSQAGLFGGGDIIPKKTATSKENYSPLKPRASDVAAAMAKKKDSPAGDLFAQTGGGRGAGLFSEQNVRAAQDKPKNEHSGDSNTPDEMKRYKEIKKLYPEHVIAVQTDEGLIFFGDDAKKVANTSGSKINGDSFKIDRDAFINNLLPKLIRRGERVSILEKTNR